jgi:hypothetical protein
LPGGTAPGSAGDVFPTVNFAGPNAPNVWAGTNAVAFNQTQNVWTMVDNLLWVRGKHAVAFGFQLQRQQDNNMNPDGGTRATFSFSNNEPAAFSPTGTLLTTTGNAYASYLLGAVDSSSITDNYVRTPASFTTTCGWNLTNRRKAAIPAGSRPRSGPRR